jgi:hypothetical protein
MSCESIDTEKQNAVNMVEKSKVLIESNPNFVPKDKEISISCIRCKLRQKDDNSKDCRFDLARMRFRIGIMVTGSG